MSNFWGAVQPQIRVSDDLFYYPQSLQIEFFNYFQIVVQFVHQRLTGRNFQAHDVFVGNASMCFANARRELPCAATKTRLPLRIAGAICLPRTAVRVPK